MFDVFSVSGWVEEVFEGGRKVEEWGWGLSSWVEEVFEGGCKVGEADGVGLGREWMDGRGAKHIEHAQTGMFDMFEGGWGRAGV